MAKLVCVTVALAWTVCCFGQAPSPTEPCPKVTLTKNEAGILRCDLARATAAEVNTRMAAANLPKLSFVPVGKSILLINWTADADQRMVDLARGLVSSLDSPSGSRDSTPPSEGHVLQLFNNRDANSVLTALGLGGSSTPKVGALGDLIVLSPGVDTDDSKIQELKRQIALLDESRPQVALSVWSVRLSSKDPATVESGAQVIRRTVSIYNTSLQRALERGWGHLNDRIAVANDDVFKAGAAPATDFFDPLFYRYMVLRYVAPADGEMWSGAGTSKEQQELEERTLGQQLNACSPDRYCLGFRPFSPLRPTLSNMVIALAAAREAKKEAACFVDFMEDVPSTCPSPSSPPVAAGSCLDRDREALDKQYTLYASNQSPHASFEPKPVFACLREQLQVSLDSTNRVNSDLGLLRASIADFLFNYKQATQYSHDFIPYDLIQSAQNLDAQLDPILVAFNQDIAVLLEHLQTKLADKITGESKVTYSSNGIVTVRTLSGSPAKVDTKTANYFDATEPPSLTDLLTELKSADSNLSSVIKDNLSGHASQILAAGLNVVKPTIAKLGEKSHLEVTPWSLAGAGGAELKVKFQNGEESPPTVGGGSAGASTKEDTASRVAQHDVETDVRVDSLKLFELSSFSATLTRGRKNIPIILPLFELPYIGSIVSWPVSPARTYHRSFVVVSAVIVPTAADVANSIDYTGDRYLRKAARCDPATKSGCHPELAHFWRRQDLPHEVRGFHKAMYRCLLSGNQPTKLVGGEEVNCSNLTFNDVAAAPH